MRWPNTEQDFWNKALPLDGGCWEWQSGPKTKGKHGRFRFNGKYDGAHRVAYLLTHGQITPGMYICHTCDNPSCVNPEHLYEGTNQDNQIDAVERGQHWYINPHIQKTHCSRGHEYSEENTYYKPKNGHRDCKTCLNMRHKLWKERHHSLATR